LEQLARIAALVVRDIKLSAKTDREDVAAYAASTLRDYVERREIEEALRATAEYATALTASLQPGSSAASSAEKVRVAIENARQVLTQGSEDQSCRLRQVFDAVEKRHMGKQILVLESADKPGEPVPEQFKLAVPDSLLSGILDTLVTMASATLSGSATSSSPVRITVAVKGTDAEIRVTPGAAARGSDFVIARGAAIAFRGDLKPDESTGAFRLRLPVA
jgi:hypothetical protein